MTSRQRFHQTMRFGSPDRPPCFEEGLREDVLATWREQGMPAERDLGELFDFDRRERIPADIDLTRSLDCWPRTTRELPRFRDHLQRQLWSRWPKDWDQRVAAWRDRDWVLELPLHRGLFLSMGVHDWSRFLEVELLLHDDPKLVRGMLEAHATCYTQLAARVLEEVEVDYVSFSEPIGGNDGPLISPAMYRSLVLESYAPVIEVVRGHGVDILCFVTYANARVLLHAVVDAGFNCLWACEVDSAAMDYLDIRREFGPRLRLIGNFDVDALHDGEQRIRREMETRVLPLLEQGGYAPLADGRIRADVTWERYRFYRRLLERMAYTAQRRP